MGALLPVLMVWRIKSVLPISNSFLEKIPAYFLMNCFAVCICSEESSLGSYSMTGNKC
jgi:hypothetical protein